MSSRKRPQEDLDPPEKKHKMTKDAVALERRRHYGLVNQGTTCYLNSVLQVLYMTSEIHDKLNPKLRITDTDEQLRILFKNLEKKTCGTENITKTLGIHNVHQQGDAAECLDMILQRINPEASKVFKGELTETTKCSNDHVIIEETNPFWTLPLSLKNNQDEVYSVQAGFEGIFHTKPHSGNNKVYCNKCKDKTEATSGCEMVEFPHILTLLLKRFDFDNNTMSHVKLDCSVDVPSTLKKNDKRYKLYGIVNHMGSLRGGHYTATVLRRENDTWYLCDDSHIKKVEKQPFAAKGTHSSSTAYLLMYRDSGKEVTKGERGKNSPLAERSQRNPWCILLIVVGGVALVIFLIIVTTMNA